MAGRPITALPRPPIQNLPQPLMGLLNLKSFGRLPSQLLDTLQGTVDLTQLYVNFQIVDFTALFGGNGTIAIATAAPGTYVFSTNPLTVPLGVWAWVEGYTVQCSLLAAESIRFVGMLLTSAAANAGKQAVTYDYADIVTARARAATASSLHGFWAPPGSQLGVFVEDILTAATITVSGIGRGAFFRV